MQSFDFKKLLPHILIIVGFAVLAILFSFPQIDGMVLRQGDNVSWKASAKEAMDWHEETGENTMWSNSMFSGMPTYTHYVPETNNYIHFIQEAVMSVMGKPAGFIFLAMAGFYILMLIMGVNRWLAIAGAVAYAFSTYNITLIAAGHETKMWALAYMPAVIGGVIQIYRAKWWSGVPILGISLALLMTTGHYQIMYYTIIVILGMVITYFIKAMKEKVLKQFFISSVISLVIALIAVGPSMQLFMATLEYNKTTMRGGESELTLNHDKDKKGGGLDKDYAFLWSNSATESFTVLVPFLYGGASSENVGENSETYDVMTSIGVPPQSAEGFTANLPTYWGPQPFTGGPFYFGAIICFLFVLGLIVIKSVHKWWIVAVCLFAFIFSIGDQPPFRELNYIIFDTLPAFNKFRVPNMILTIPQMLFPLLGIWALNDIIVGKMSKEEVWKKVKLAGIITGSLALLLSIGGSMFFSYKGDNDVKLQQQLTQSFQNEQAASQVLSAIQEDRSAMAIESGIVSVIFIALVLGLLWGYSKNKLKAEHVAIGVVVLVAIDLIRVDTRYLNEDNYVYEDDYEQQFAPRPVDMQIKQDPDPYYRVLDLSRNTYNDAIQAAHHKSIGGYSPAKMEVYQDMIDMHLGGAYNNGQYNTEVVNMLNTKYIISPQGQNGQPVAIPNPEANGNAWFVSEINWVPTADEEMLSMTAPSLGQIDTTGGSFNSKQTAIVRDSYKPELQGYQFGKDSSASIKLTKYGLNDLSFESNNSQNGFAVFSDIYYPYGWEAYIDGEQAEIIKANYLLRGLKIPAGKHKIEFKFEPQTFYTGDKIAAATSVLLILISIGSVVMAFKKEKTA